ncbi:MAG: HIT domain-containing protein [Armatimonadetes bacterium]|nr:HIT domain-containing protein [Armatimonadota bacterium]
MERLWAPWRMQYIDRGETEGCIFCDKPRLADSEALIVHRAQHTFVMMNAFPYNNGHVLIAPYKHTSSIGDLSRDERLEIMDMLDLCIQTLKLTANPEGYNFGANLGRVAGAGVAEHVHFHLVPRWNGDTNFMPVVADTKVLPEALQTVCDKLREALKRSKPQS